MFVCVLFVCFLHVCVHQSVEIDESKRQMAIAEARERRRQQYLAHTAATSRTNSSVPAPAPMSASVAAPAPESGLETVPPKCLSIIIFDG